MRIVNALDAGWLLDKLGIIKPLAAKTFDYIPFTSIFNPTGQQAMSVPLYRNAADLPIGTSGSPGLAPTRRCSALPANWRVRQRGSSADRPAIETDVI